MYPFFHSNDMLRSHGSPSTPCLHEVLWICRHHKFCPKLIRFFSPKAKLKTKATTCSMKTFFRNVCYMQNLLIITAWKWVKWNTKILFCPNTTKKISRTLWNASYLCLLCLPFQVLPFPLVALLDLEHETSISKTSQNMVLYQAILISVWSLTLMVLILVTTRNSYNLQKLMLRQHTHTHTGKTAEGQTKFMKYLNAT